MAKKARPRSSLTDQTIFRRAKDRANPYVMIDREMFEVESMSWKAKGLLGYLLSRPDDWTVRMIDLIRRSTDGEHAVRTAVAELEAHGYMVRERERDPATGRFGPVTIEVHEIPVPPTQRTADLGRSRLRGVKPKGNGDAPAPVGENRPLDPDAPPPVGGFPQVEKPHVDYPHVENQGLLSTDVLSTEEPSTEVQKADPGADAPGPPPTPTCWPEWVTAFEAESNPIALIRFMIETLYPALDPPPSYGQIGAIAKQMGEKRNGQRRLMGLVWEHSKRPPDGDLLPYLLRVHQRKVHEREETDHTSQEGRRRYVSGEYGDMIQH